MPNKFGLPRDIPYPIKREIRRRSKNGCVICRAGIYDYEHIEPEYSEAKCHRPEDICCLCPSCHSKVTRGHYSKAFVRTEYDRVRNASSTEVGHPFGDIDFHEGKADLKLGGLQYGPGVTSVVRYHGYDVFSITPSTEGGTAGINATFLDCEGEQTLRIVDNVWHGVLDPWDTEVVGHRIKVRQRQGAFAVILRLEPPGGVVIERLDMRIQDAHLLVSEQSYAIGRYNRDGDIYWFYADMIHVEAPLPAACAIEFVMPDEVEIRDQKWIGRGQRLVTADNGIVFQSGLGVANKAMGVIVGANCLRFGIGKYAFGGPRPLAKMRKFVFDEPARVAEYIGTGKS